MEVRASAPESGKGGGIDNDDPLDIMIEQKRRDEEGVFNDSMNNLNPTKTPSTAEHGSVKGHVSFESHSNNLNTLGANEITNFEQNMGSGNNEENLRQPAKKPAK